MMNRKKEYERIKENVFDRQEKYLVNVFILMRLDKTKEFMVNRSDS